MLQKIQLSSSVFQASTSPLLIKCGKVKGYCYISSSANETWNRLSWFVNLSTLEYYSGYKSSQIYKA